MRQMIGELNNILGGWITCFRFAEGKANLERLGEWMWRKHRCVILKRLKRAKRTEDFLQSLRVPAFQAWILTLSVWKRVVVKNASPMARTP